jgi:hypothetical protein
MKHSITAFIFTGLLISCNSSDKTNTPTENFIEIETKTKSISIDSGKALQSIATDADLIATALLAAPKASRSESKVIGYNMKGEFVTLKEGTNEFIILADNPNKSGFSAACYHKDLEPFMARGRVLKAEGKTPQDIFEIREEEMKSGALKITTGATLHIYSGAKTEFNPETFKVDGAKLRYVVYMPFATSASTGLPEAPAASNHPWIMNPGTHRAHIMISPLPEENN